MGAAQIIKGAMELRKVRQRSRHLYWAVALFSLFANFLMLSGPIYMLQVYDRVLGSGSHETLLALTILLAFLYLMMGLFEHARSRILSRIGARFQNDLDSRVFEAMVHVSSRGPDAKTATSLNDLQAIRQLMASSFVTAVFDLPWTPLFFGAIFLFHPMLGWLAIAGAVTLIFLMVSHQLVSRRKQTSASLAEREGIAIADQIRVEAENVSAIGMQINARERWQVPRGQALRQQVVVSDISDTFRIITKTFRLFLQSAVLGLGAWLVLSGQMTAGGMFAGSILLGRGLAPIEALIGQWAIAQRGFQGWENLSWLLGSVPVPVQRCKLPKPSGALVARGMSVVPPGARHATLRGVTFSLEPGQAIGVIGPSGAGKSTLSRALVGVWKPAAGSLQLGGAFLDQFDPVTLGRYIGYLPQRVPLFDGTIAQNIARLDAAPDDEKVVAAAQMASAHEMILALPEGYQTQITGGQSQLSGGQVQRIGLARALFGDPVLLVLDEPNSNLDSVGSKALNTAIRQMKARGGSVLIMAHRPAAIQECDLLMVLDGGRCTAFGPKEEVMSQMVQNAENITVAAHAVKGAA